MRALLDIGARIAAARKTVRYEQRFYCPHDGRMVGAVVPFEGERYLWIVGGRDEHSRSLLADLFQELTSWRDTHRPAHRTLHRRQDPLDLGPHLIVQHRHTGHVLSIKPDHAQHRRHALVDSGQVPEAKAYFGETVTVREFIAFVKGNCSDNPLVLPFL